MATQTHPGPNLSQRKRSSVYVDDGFDAYNGTGAQESLSAFGLKLIDSKRSIAELYGITTSSSSTPALPHAPQNSGVDMHHRKKKKKSQITLADLNSAVDVDALLKKNDLSSAGHGAQDGKATVGENDPGPVYTERDKLPRTISDSPANTSPDIALSLNSAATTLPNQFISDSHPADGSNSQTKEAVEHRPVSTQVSKSHPSATKNRSTKRGFFNVQLPSRIPKRPHPEKFDSSKKPPPPRTSAMRQLNAISSKGSLSGSETPDATASQSRAELSKSDSAVLASREDLPVAPICEKVASELSPTELYTKPRSHASHHLPHQPCCGFSERNTDPALPRNPEVAVKLLPNLPLEKRSAFLEHIFFFFNHIHLATLVKPQNGNFLKYMEKWITDGIYSNDSKLLRALLLLLEILPVTPSIHCRGIVKTMKANKFGDSIIANLVNRVNDKWQLLEQTIRSHKAHREKAIECKRSISFCDETEMLEYSIHLPPDTVRKSKKNAIKGVLKQSLRVTAIKDAPPSPRGASASLSGSVEFHPQDPRLKSAQLESGNNSSVSNQTESVSSSDLTALRQSLDAEVPSKMSVVPLGGDIQAIAAKDCVNYSAYSDRIAPEVRSEKTNAHSTNSDQVNNPPIAVACSVDSGHLDVSQCDFSKPANIPVHPPTEIAASRSSAAAKDSGQSPSTTNFVTENLPSALPEKSMNTSTLSGVALFNSACRTENRSDLHSSSHFVKHSPTSMRPVEDRDFFGNISQQVFSAPSSTGDSIDGLLSLVPSIVKDFSSLLTFPQSYPLSSATPNPYLSSSKAIKAQIPFNRSVSAPLDHGIAETTCQSR